MPEDGHVKLTPGQFLDVGLNGGRGARCREGAGIQFTDGNETKAQVLPEAGGSLPRRSVPLFAVASDDAGIDYVFQAIPRGALAGLRDVCRAGRKFPVVQSRNGQTGQSRTGRNSERLDDRKRCDLWLREPVSTVGCVNPVGLTTAGEDLTRLVHDAVFEVMKRDAASGTHLLDPLLDLTSMGIVIPIPINGGGTRLNGEALQLDLRGASSEKESRAEGFEIFRERRQASAKELLAVAARPAVLFFPSAEDVNGDHVIAPGSCVMKGGIVRETQIATEPVEDDGR